MTNVRAQPGATRILSSQSLSFGSTAGASSAPFGVSTTLVRAMSNTPATIIIGDLPSVNSVTIANSGFPIPASLPEYFTVTAGQRLVAVAPTTSTATLVVSECG